MILQPGESVRCWVLSDPSTGEVPISMICTSEEELEALKRLQRVHQPHSPYTKRVEVVVSIVAS